MNISYAIVIKDGATRQNADIGFLNPVFVETSDGKKYPADTHFPCDSKKIFVIGGYSSIDERFKDGTLFRISVREDSRFEEKKATQVNPCRFITEGNSSRIENGPQKIEDKELVEVVGHNLPSPSNPIIFTENKPLTRYLALISDDNSIYYLFEHGNNIESSNEKFDAFSIKIAQTPLMLINQQSAYIKQVYKSSLKKLEESNHLISSKVNGVIRNFIRDIHIVIRKENSEQVEFISDQDILETGFKMIETTSPTSFNKNLVPLYKKNFYNKHKNSPIAIKFLERFFLIIEQLDGFSGDVSKSIESFFKTEQGKRLLDGYIINNQRIYEKLSDSVKAKIKEDADLTENQLKIQLSQLNEKIEEGTKKLADLNRNREIKENEIIEQNSTEEAAAAIDLLGDKLNLEIQQKRTVLDKIIKDLSTAQQKINHVHNIERLEWEIESLNSRHARAEQAHRALEQANASLKAELARHDSDLLKKLIEWRPYVDSLTGIYSEPNNIVDVDLNVPIKSINYSDKSELLKERDAFVGAVKSFFAKHGRILSSAEVANFLICRQQSFITILAGLPGVGKTSLVQLLSEASGIGKRLVPISVGRGWTSVRDLIGYHNPLSKKFQPAANKFFPFLLAIEKECKELSDRKKAALSVILLDEANLSPIEHYWSSFMGMTDRSINRNIMLGEHEFDLSESVRFFATINFDSTTEALSPRMLDRAPVILLEPSVDFSPNSDCSEDIKSSQTTYTTEILNEWFGIPVSGAGWLEAGGDVIEEFTKIMSGNSIKNSLPITLSQRKKQAVRNFIIKSDPLMRVERENLAIDYAISQFMLPLISGSGDGYRLRLEKMLEFLDKEDLSISFAILSAIIERGRQDLETYSFFSW